MSGARAPGDFRVLLLSPALIDEPLGTMYLASALRARGYDVTGILFNHGSWTPGELADRVEAIDPSIVAFAVITGEHRQCLELSRHLAERHRHLTVLGGPYLTFAPETIYANGHVDVIARGECETALVELCDRLRLGIDHRSIPNLWVRTDDVVTENPLGELCPIDDLPNPDREIFRSSKADGTYNLMSSRGCPYKCTYCFNDRFVELHRPRSKGGERLGTGPTPVVRNRSIDAVVDEMREVAERCTVTQFNFHDDIFPIRRSRTLEFCSAYEASGLGIPWSCSVKAELLDDELLEAMARAGCNKVYMGVEAGDDGIRNDLLLRRVSRTQMIEAARSIRSAGIQLYTQSMVGLPGTTLEDDLETMRFNAVLRPTFAWVSIFTPYPGTALADRALALGLVDPDFMDTMPNTYHYRSILRVPHASLTSNLHKLFSLGVDHPDLIPQIGALLAESGPDDLDALHHAVFLPFRSWKHEQLRSSSAPCEPHLTDFIGALRAHDVHAALGIARRSAGGPRDDQVAAGLMSRDGVDSRVGPRMSPDRHAAAP